MWKLEISKRNIINLFLTKEQRIQWRMANLFKKSYWENWTPVYQKRNLDIDIIP